MEVVDTLAEPDTLGVTDKSALAEATEGEEVCVPRGVEVTHCDTDGDGLKEADWHAEAVKVVEAPGLGVK